MALFTSIEQLCGVSPTEPEILKEIMSRKVDIKSIVYQAISLEEGRRFMDNKKSVRKFSTQLKVALGGWVKAGLIAGEIFYTKAYKKLGYPTWKSYCENYIGLNVWQVDRMRKAAKVVLFLIENLYETLPSCVSQAMELYSLLKKKSHKLLEYWDKVCILYKPHEITAKKIAMVMGKKKKSRFVKLGEKICDSTAELASKLGTSVDYCLSNLVVEKLAELSMYPEGKEKFDREREEKIDSLTYELYRLYEEKKQREDSLKKASFFFNFSLMMTQLWDFSTMDFDGTK